MNSSDLKEYISLYWWCTLTFIGVFLIYLSCTDTIIFTNPGFIFLLGVGDCIIGMSIWTSVRRKDNHIVFKYNLLRRLTLAVGVIIFVLSFLLITKDIIQITPTHPDYTSNRSTHP